MLGICVEAMTSKPYGKAEKARAKEHRQWLADTHVDYLEDARQGEVRKMLLHDTFPIARGERRKMSLHDNTPIFQERRDAR